jgi:hypothetical protein
MQDRPTAVELLRAARDFCERDLLPELTGRRQFHTRVLINVLGILEREWLGEEDALRAEWERLDALLGPQGIPEGFRALTDATKERNRELSARIRSGELDDRWHETLEALRATVAEKLRIANPRHSEGTSSAT